jgi:hypothetical protein
VRDLGGDCDRVCGQWGVGAGGLPGQEIRKIIQARPPDDFAVEKGVLSAMDDMPPNRPGDPDRGEATTAALGAIGDQQPDAVDYDAELRLYNEILRPACGVRPRDHVIDIGCGTG